MKKLRENGTKVVVVEGHLLAPVPKPVWSKYSCGAAVVPEQPAEAFSTADATSPTGLKRSRGREEQNVVLALVVAFFVIMLLELGERLPQRSFPEQDQMG